MKKAQIEMDREKTCEGLARSEYALLQRTGRLTPYALTVIKATFRAKYTEADAQRMCTEIDRLYLSPSLF
jgi:hypothetical protein